MKSYYKIIFAILIITCFQKSFAQNLPDMLPQGANPDYETLRYYHFKYLNRTSYYDKVSIKASTKPYEFKFNLKKNDENKFIVNQLDKTALTSYLKYEDNQITMDMRSNKFFLEDDLQLYGHSYGKTITSYILGHAICDGYIDSLDSKIDDWNLIKGSIYDNQKIIDVINMTAGDQKIVKYQYFKNGKGQVSDGSLKFLMMREDIKQEISKKKYNYNGLTANIILNYIYFKTQNNFSYLLDKIFNDKVGIKNEVYFTRHPNQNLDDGPIRAVFYATRYDYLRIARAMLNDWNNDTCVGKYLKTLYKNKIKKNENRQTQTPFVLAKAYAGFFHTDYPGMNNRHVMGMDGYGGQSLLIDFDNKIIIAVHAIHENYNWKKIVLIPIKKSN